MLHLASLPFLLFSLHDIFLWKGGERAMQENKYHELYDLKTDPYELHNLYGQPGTEKVEKELKKLLDNYRKNLKVDE